jgi:hypothetical protein
MRQEVMLGLDELCDTALAGIVAYKPHNAMPAIRPVLDKLYVHAGWLMAGRIRHPAWATHAAHLADVAAALTDLAAAQHGGKSIGGVLGVLF